MPDDKVYGFNKADTIEVINLIGNTDGEFPEIVPRDLGGDGATYQGTLTALTDGTGHYTGKKVGTVMVEVGPCNEGTVVGTSVQVVDWSGCVFDLPIEDLDGVWVWFGRGIAASQDPEAEEGELTPCHYVAHDRCCVAGDA
jgi:hypothetical protein